MKSVTDGLIGVITQRTYRVEVWKMDALKLAVTDEKWVYITKYHHNGQIGERSIGLPESDVATLVALLGEAAPREAMP
jgi:hypothetical protein